MEQSFVAWAKIRASQLHMARIDAGLDNKLKLGIGDDAAVLSGGPEDVVITTDSLMDGTHFILSEVDPRRIGRKLVNVNLSDLAAMAAEPESLFLSLCLPRNESDAVAAEIFEGVCEAAAAFHCSIAGGDTNCWNGPLVLHLTAVGRSTAAGIWTRSGAQAEDAIVVTGPLGGSLLGKHLDFVPRIDWARRVRERIKVHAAMDISDGLSNDLLRMCNASGCGATLDLQSIPISDAAHQMAKQTGREPLACALGDGEDFELLLAIPPDQLDELRSIVGDDQAIEVGRFTSRTGLWSKRGSRVEQLPATGYVHQ